jgi:hypothetical protein
MKMIDDQNRKEIIDLISEASGDLDEFFSKIKKSEKILKYKSNGELIGQIFIYILCSFSLAQILEMSNKNKMVDNKSGKVFSPSERFEFYISGYKEHFDFVYAQYQEMLKCEKI